MTDKISEKTKTDYGFVKPVVKLAVFAFLVQLIYERAMIYAVQGRDFRNYVSKLETKFLFRNVEASFIPNNRRVTGDL